MTRPQYSISIGRQCSTLGLYGRPGHRLSRSTVGHANSRPWFIRTLGLHYACPRHSRPTVGQSMSTLCLQWTSS